jgi:hypothetical protein
MSCWSSSCSRNCSTSCSRNCSTSCSRNCLRRRPASALQPSEHAWLPPDERLRKGLRGETRKRSIRWTPATPCRIERRILSAKSFKAPRPWRPAITDCWCAWLLTTRCNPASCQWTSHKLLADRACERSPLFVARHANRATPGMNATSVPTRHDPARHTANHLCSKRMQQGHGSCSTSRRAPRTEERLRSRRLFQTLDSPRKVATQVKQYKAP